MKKVPFAILTVLIVLGAGVFNSQQGQATAIYPLNNNSIEIYENSESQERKLLIRINENGHFYLEVLEGEDKGSFEAWDGENFYRYSKEYIDLIIVKDPKDGSKVIAHPFLSDVINDRIIEDISNKDLKKSFWTDEYKKIEIAGEQEIVETVKFDEKHQFPQQYKMEVDDQEILEFEITKVNELKEHLDIQ